MRFSHKIVASQKSQCTSSWIKLELSCSLSLTNTKPYINIQYPYQQYHGNPLTYLNFVLRGNFPFKRLAQWTILAVQLQETPNFTYKQNIFESRWQSACRITSNMVTHLYFEQNFTTLKSDNCLRSFPFNAVSATTLKAINTTVFRGLIIRRVLASHQLMRLIHAASWLASSN